MLMLFYQIALVAVSVANAAVGQISYENPILQGFNPDPSCIRVNQDFFCATSTFNFWPGIPIYTSRDLIHWTQLGHVISRLNQVPQFAALNGSTSGIWAPTLRYHNEIFYVTTALVHDKQAPDDISRFENMIFTTQDIFLGHWSDPIYFSPPFLGYDCSLFWDDDGTSYVQISHNYRVAVGIWNYKIDVTTGAISDGELLWNGTGGLAPEGPHIYKKHGYYYLLIAEGGTGVGHMVTMARASSIHGPYESYTRNPVYTNANTTYYLQDVGHADLFTDADGNWWGVSLAVRNGTWNFPIGRETSLTPVIWKNGQYPIFDPPNPGHVTVNMAGPLPQADPQAMDVNQILIHRTFPPGSKVPYEFLYWRLPNESSYEVSPSHHPNALILYGSAQNLTGSTLTGSMTFIARRQQHLEFTSTVSLEFDPRVLGEEAGLTLFCTPALHFDLGVILKQDGKYMRLRTSTDPDPSSSIGNVRLQEGASQFLFKL